MILLAFSPNFFLETVDFGSGISFFPGFKGAADGRFSHGSGFALVWQGAADGRFPVSTLPR